MYHGLLILKQKPSLYVKVNRIIEVYNVVNCVTCLVTEMQCLHIFKINYILLDLYQYAVLVTGNYILYIIKIAKHMKTCFKCIYL